MDGQWSLITETDLSADGIQDGGLDTKEWNCGRARLGLDGTWERRHNDRTSLGLPIKKSMRSEDDNDNHNKSLDIPKSVNNRALFPSNMLVVPVPCLWINRLAHATEHSQAAQIILFDMVRPKSTQQADSSGRGVELGDLILIDSLPVARRAGIDGGGFEDGCCHAVGEGSVNDVAREKYINK
jgi:hypothetical protein